MTGGDLSFYTLYVTRLGVTTYCFACDMQSIGSDKPRDITGEIIIEILIFNTGFVLCDIIYVFL
jgi:hypothetical protein